ncbi:MAG TPA: serine/threonine protein kinase, partial [Acidobacteria bacterium]|nr:serine/threonine protein kinase [Acidobacteriota bacterium]
LREVQICRRISHPNVVRVFDIGRFAGGLFITMEYIEGESLERLLVREAPLSFPRIRFFLGEIAAGLEEAHAQGIVHRDLKPANLMVTGSRLKILDFGIARMAGLGARLTQTGCVLGTPLYMSPDQLRGQEVDGRSDLYSFGIVGFTLIAGREPFDAPDATALALKQLHEAPPDVRRVRPETPAPWAELIDRLLKKTPAERYQTAREVREVLAALPV